MTLPFACLELEPGVTTRATYDGFAFVGKEHISYDAPTDGCEWTQFA